MTENRNEYLLLGPETGEKNEFIQRLKKNLGEKYKGEPDEYVFYPYDTEMSEVIPLLRNISLFAPAKFVIIKSCHDLKKKDTALLCEYLKTPADDTLLVLVSESTRVDSSLEKCITPSNRKIFWEMFDSRKKGWVAGFFQKQGIPIEPGAIDFLVDMLEGDTETLKKECSNLALFFSSSSEITPEITEEKISDFFYSRKEENPVSLFSHIASRNLEKALEAAENIFLSGDSSPVQVLGGLLWQLRTAGEIRKLLEKKVSFQEACASLNIKAKKMQASYSEATSKYTRRELEEIITLTARHDFLFRSNRMEIQRILFSTFLYSVIVRGGKGIGTEKAVRKVSGYLSGN